MSIENKKGASRNNSSINLPKSQTSTKEETPRKEVSSQDNDIEINGSPSSSLSHISEMLSKKKLNYSQICNKVPYHNANKDNFVFNMINSRNNMRIDKMSDMMSNMKNSFEMISRRNSITATTGCNNNNNTSVKVSCCLFSKK